MSAPTCLPYRTLADLTTAARSASRAFGRAEDAMIDDDTFTASSRLDDGVTDLRRAAALLGYDLVPNAHAKVEGRS